MNKVAARAGILILLVLVLLAGIIFFVFEYVTQAGNWVTFTGSPHIYNGGNIGCGLVTDRDGNVLLDLNNGRKYCEDERLRLATVHWVGDRSGSVSAPALTAYSQELAGFELVNGVYSYGKTGGTAQLTLSGGVQTAALEALGTYKGTIGVYNYKTGEILCAVTTPTFDPDNVPDISADSEKYEGVYINRFVQSRYTPGSVFKIVTLAAALESIEDITEQTFECKGKLEFGTNAITCEDKHYKQTLKEAFRNSCNCAFAQIALQVGAEKLSLYAQQFGVTGQITFDGITTPQGNFDTTNAADVSIAWSGIGQHTDLINPCAFMTFVGAVAAEGKGVNPYVVRQVSGYRAKTVKNQRIMSKETAEVLREYMAFNVTDKYGSEHFPGLTVCAKTGTAEVGGEKKPNAVLTGFVSDEKYPLAFIAIVEDGGYGREICIPMMRKVLAACKEVMDK